MTQYGFYFDANNCIGCKTCQVACKDAHHLPMGVNYRTVRMYQTGEFPEVGLYNISMSCNHCANPACASACPNGAIAKEPETGIVAIDQAKCKGCGTCVAACPYGAISVNPQTTCAGKCDACVEFTAQGEKPVCVAACPMRVLEFGPVDELAAKHAGEQLVCDCAALPDSKVAGPQLLMRIKAIMNDPDFDEVFN